MTSPIFRVVPRRPPSRLQRALVTFRQWVCGLNGHDRYRHVEGARVTMRCVDCQHDTPGWDLGQRAYQRTYSGDPARHRLVPESAAMRARRQMRAVK